MGFVYVGTDAVIHLTATRPEPPAPANETKLPLPDMPAPPPEPVPYAPFVAPPTASTAGRPSTYPELPPMPDPPIPRLAVVVYKR